MKTLLCLLSRQHVPNLLSVHHFQPERLVLLESSDMQQEAAKRAEEVAKQAAREARFAGLSPALRKLVEQADTEHWTVGQSQFFDGLDRYLKQTPTPSGDVIAWIRDTCLEKFWKGIWADTDAKRGKKLDKPKFESKRARELTHRFKAIAAE